MLNQLFSKKRFLSRHRRQNQVLALMENCRCHDLIRN
jgi:hypothetical protein